MRGTLPILIQPCGCATDGDCLRGGYSQPGRGLCLHDQVALDSALSGVNSGDMEKGAQVANRISACVLAQKERGEYGTKVEVKNLNSFRSMRSAIAFELIAKSVSMKMAARSNR